MSKPKTSHPHKFRAAAPAAVPNLVALLNDRITVDNARAWRDFSFNGSFELFVDEQPGRASTITLEHEAIKVRIELAPDFAPYRVRWTLLTPAILQTIAPEQVRRIVWRYRKRFE
jgi:hypothetical protein